MMKALFLAILGGAVAKVRDHATCVSLEGVAVRGPILKSLAGVSNPEVCCNECSLEKTCSAYTINNTVCELHQFTSVYPSASMTSGIINAMPDPAAIAAFYTKVRDSPDNVRYAIELDWQSRGLNDSDCAVMAYIFKSMGLANLAELYLQANQTGDEGMKAFSSALTSAGSLVNLTKLYLHYNQIGDEGMQAFSSALTSGSLANLEVLSLGDNMIGDAGMKAFATKLSSGALANLTQLWLHSNQFKDEGMKAFSSALTSGSLANLELLDLPYNQIGDAGMEAFATKLSSGALANLTELWLSENIIGDKGMEAFTSALSSGALAISMTPYHSL
jgi:Leucine-rich repeat (LRR) protein